MANLAPIPAGTDPNQVTAMMNRNFQQLNNEQVTKLYNDSTGTPSVLIGLDSTGNGRVKVAKPGIDVTTATDAQLAFNSAQNTLKVVMTGTAAVPNVTVPAPGAGNYGNAESTNIIAHGLGYVPIILAFAESSGAYFPLPRTTFSRASPTTASWSQYDTIVDATNIYISNSIMTYGFGTTAVGFNIKYYLLQETAS